MIPVVAEDGNALSGAVVASGGGDVAEGDPVDLVVVENEWRW